MGLTDTVTTLARDACEAAEDELEAEAMTAMIFSVSFVSINDDCLDDEQTPMVHSNLTNLVFQCYTGT